MRYDLMPLSHYCRFADDRISVSQLTTDNYISTENMLQNKAGITISNGLPTTNQTAAFKVDDILVSNIRPYFKKIWLAKFNGGCSNDVLVFRSKENCDASFMYYVLSSDTFFDYATSTAKGTKMPRGDKAAIMRFSTPKVSLQNQKAIAETLSCLDDKIELNNRINKNLEEQAQAIFNEWFFGNNAKDNWGTLSDIAEINPFRKLTKGTVARYIEMSNLATTGAFPLGWEEKSYYGGMKFINGDTLLARITPCLENGKGAYINFLNEDEVAFGSTEYIVITGKNGYCNEFFYFLIRYLDFRLYAAKSMTGSSGRQRVSAESIANYKMPIPSLELSKRFHEIAAQIMASNCNRSLENRILSTLRDTLLPKLMSGEIEIPQEV